MVPTATPVERPAFSLRVIEGGGGSTHAGVTAERAKDGGQRAVESDARRDQILSDPEIHKEIRKVARIRNVPASEIDDVLQDVLKEACVDPGLPLEDRDAARRYLGVCARNKSVDRERARRRRRARFVPADDEMAAPGALSMEERATAWRLFEESKERFPRTHAWFERFALEGESDVAIAQEANVSPSRVRAAVSEVRLWLRGYGVVTAAAVVIELDPQGETPELELLRQKVSDKIETLEAKPRRRH
jgi:DNA-directed RNA polymerase specialized sigma24 family protein